MGYYTGDASCFEYSSQILGTRIWACQNVKMQTGTILASLSLNRLKQTKNSHEFHTCLTICWLK